MPTLFCQVPVDYIPNKSNISDTIIVPIDSLKALGKKTFPENFYNRIKSRDSLYALTDTLLPREDYKLSKDAIEAEVKYDARDSSWVDLTNEKIHLYGGAVVDYQKIKVTANYMIIDFANNIIEGYFKKDSINNDKDKPTFSDGENTFTYKEIRYNFKSKKGLVDHAITKQGEFNLVGSRTKYISGQTDSLGVKADDEIYNKNAIITTCTHDPPHYGIRADKLKFVPK